jgi:hypothetical protein
MIYRGPGIPTPSPSPVSKLSSSSCVSPVELTDGRRGGSGGGARSYDAEKAWSYIYHSILSKKNMKYSTCIQDIQVTHSQNSNGRFVSYSYRTHRRLLYTRLLSVLGYLYTMDQITIKTPKCRLFLKIDL